MPRDVKPTRKKAAEEWEVVEPLLNSMAQEFKELSKKKPDGPCSKRKISVANRLLERCREVLRDEPQLQFLDLFDDDDLPTYSDVTLMLSQYVAAIETFRAAHHRGYDGWSVLDDDDEYDDSEYDDGEEDEEDEVGDDEPTQ